VMTDCGAYRHRLKLDTKSCRTVALGDLTASHNAIPRRYYRFGTSWPHVRGNLLVALEQDGDPFAVMVPTAEIIRFYYAPSTRLAQALFGGEYNQTFNAERSGIFDEGVVRVHRRRWLEDQDAWTLGRYICSPVMQREASRLYKGLPLYHLNSANLIAEPDQSLPCGFPFEGATTLQGHMSGFARADTEQFAALADPSHRAVFGAVPLRQSDRGPGQQQRTWRKHGGRESGASLGEGRKQ
jgi:hypothetical protein